MGNVDNLLNSKLSKMKHDQPDGYILHHLVVQTDGPPVGP
jgi:hypothetical protein